MLEVGLELKKELTNTQIRLEQAIKEKHDAFRVLEKFADQRDEDKAYIEVLESVLNYLKDVEISQPKEYGDFSIMYVQGVELQKKVTQAVIAQNKYWHGSVKVESYNHSNNAGDHHSQ